MPKHVEHFTLNNPRGAFKFINFLAQLHVVAQVSLPNPYGWNKSWKLRKLDYYSPAVDQKRRQTTWIEVHRWHLKPEASNSMKKTSACHCPRIPKLSWQITTTKWSSLTSKKPCPNSPPLPTRLRVGLNQLLSESPPSAVNTQAAWFNFQRPLWP